MPDHACDRGAVRLDPGASRSQAYQPDEHAQTSVPNMATATPLGPPGPRRRRSSTPGCSTWTRNHPPPESVFPRARHGRSLPRWGELAFRTPARHRPEPGTWKDPIPGDGAAGDRGLRIGLPVRHWRLRDACGLSRLNDFLAL